MKQVTVRKKCPKGCGGEMMPASVQYLSITGKQLQYAHQCNKCSKEAQARSKALEESRGGAGGTGGFFSSDISGNLTVYNDTNYEDVVCYYTSYPYTYVKYEDHEKEEVWE